MSAEEEGHGSGRPFSHDASFGRPTIATSGRDAGDALPPLQLAGSRTTTAVSFCRRAAQPSMFSPL